MIRLDCEGLLILQLCRKKKIMLIIVIKFLTITTMRQNKVVVSKKTKYINFYKI